MNDQITRLIDDYQKQIASLQAENESLRTQLHRSAQREERDLELINRLAGTLAQLGEVPRAA